MPLPRPHFLFFLTFFRGVCYKERKPNFHEIHFRYTNEVIIMSKKLTALLLAALMLSAAFSGCGEQTAETSSETPGVADSAGTADDASAGETVPEETEIQPDLPEADLNGYSFRVLTRDTDHHIKEVYATELNGEVVNDAVYARNLNVEEKYNMNLEAVEVTEAPETVMQEEFRRIVLAGDNVFDVALMHTVHAGATAIEGTAYNWNEVPYVDFTKPWWNTVLSEELDYDGMLFLAVSDYCISAIDYTWAMLYNRNMAANYQIADLYDTIEEGEWDFDTFNGLTAQTSADINGNGQWDFEDQYGYVTHFNSATCNWNFAFDVRFVTRDADGEPILEPMSEKMVDITEKIYDLYFTSGTTLYLPDAKVSQMGEPSHDLAVANFFAAEKSLFAALRIYVIDELRNMEAEFGIIPFPKYDTAQEGYYTHVDGHAPLMVLPKTLQNLDNAGLILEALAYESHKEVVPAVYEIVLQSKYARDAASSRMLDLILDGRVYTFGYIYDNWQGMQWNLTNLMSSNSKDYASYYASREKAAAAQLKKTIKSFSNIKNG